MIVQERKKVTFPKLLCDEMCAYVCVCVDIYISSIQTYSKLMSLALAFENTAINKFENKCHFYNIQSS